MTTSDKTNYGTPTTAEGWITTNAKSAQVAFERLSEANYVGDGTDLYTRQLVDSTLIARLFRLLKDHAPASAEEAAADLADFCDAGDTFGELVWEWTHGTLQPGRMFGEAADGS